MSVQRKKIGEIGRPCASFFCTKSKGEEREKQRDLFNKMHETPGRAALETGGCTEKPNTQYLLRRYSTKEEQLKGNLLTLASASFSLLRSFAHRHDVDFDGFPNRTALALFFQRPSTRAFNLFSHLAVFIASAWIFRFVCLLVQYTPTSRCFLFLYSTLFETFTYLPLFQTFFSYLFFTSNLLIF